MNVTAEFRGGPKDGESIALPYPAHPIFEVAKLGSRKEDSQFSLALDDTAPYAQAIFKGQYVAMPTVIYKWVGWSKE